MTWPLFNIKYQFVFFYVLLSRILKDSRFDECTSRLLVTDIRLRVSSLLKRVVNITSSGTGRLSVTFKIIENPQTVETVTDHTTAQADRRLNNFEELFNFLDKYNNGYLLS